MKITAIGYKSKVLDSMPFGKNNFFILKMNPQIEELESVILNIAKKNVTTGNYIKTTLKKNRRLLASDIVRRAVKAIPENLINMPHSNIGYYRDYQLVDNNYYNLNEGILEQYDGGINTNKILDSLNQSVFYSYKNNKDFKTNNTYKIPYDGINKYIQNSRIKSFGGNELSILNVHNPIRNYNQYSFSFVYKMNDEFLDIHKFTKGQIEFVDGDPVITISYNLKRRFKEYVYNNSLANSEEIDLSEITNYRVSGNVKISLTNFSIYSFNYIVYDENISNPLFNVDIEYRKQDNKMQLNYITFNNRFAYVEEHVFKEESVIFNKKKAFFKVQFNSSLSPKTIKKSNFKIITNGKSININSIDIIDSKTVRLHFNENDNNLYNLNDDDFQDLGIILKNIKDARGREIYVPKLKVGYQFREFFVQESFLNKKILPDLKLVPKSSLLETSPMNNDLSKNIYIINSPLINKTMN